ncbi:MAG: hypothetical protein ABW352_25850 [Polyangiales bacterium]
MRIFFSALIVLALVACGDDEQTLPVEPPADAAVTPPAPDASAPVQSAPIPLQLWVDDLLDHHTNDDSAPDTVDDKNIADDEDSSHFQDRF